MMSVSRQYVSARTVVTVVIRPVFLAFSVVTGARPDHGDYDRFSPVFRASYDRYDRIVVREVPMCGDRDFRRDDHHGRHGCRRPLNARTQEIYQWCAIG
jgi:hypothetical protein